VSLGCRTALVLANQQMGHLIRFGLTRLVPAAA
jgi:hypothetical protein